MDGRDRRHTSAREGLLMVGAIALTVAGWVAGLAWLAAAGAAAVLGLAAAVLGIDSRSAGDWRELEPR